MGKEDEEVLRFGDFQIETGKFQVLRRGEPVALERRVYDLVLYLIRHRGRVVSKDELLEKVWRQGRLSESAVARCVSAARKEFDDPDCIQTLYGRGYRWTRPVEWVRDAVTSAADGARGQAARSIFGRERELQLAASLIERAVSGYGGVCLVSGDAGIGKTRFLRALREMSAGSGMRVIVGRCRELEGMPPHWPWPQMLRALFGDGRPPPERVRWALAQDAGLEEDRTPEPRVLVWEALAQSIIEEARERPTALLIDDFHNADAGSVSLFEFVAERAADAPLLLGSAYRPLELDRDPIRSASLSRTVRSSSPLTLELKGLGLIETRELLAVEIGSEPSAPLVQYAHELTGGNPFFLHQVAPLLGAQQIAPDAKAIVRNLPRTVRASIESQMANVSPRCRGMLDMAAVIGRVSTVSVLANALDLGPQEILGVVHEAGRAGLLFERDDDPPTLGFVHDLVREVIYEALAGPERGKLHLSVARALERSDLANNAERIDEIAHHYAHAVHAGGAPQALEYATSAAAAALGRFAYEAAREYLSRAVVLIEEGFGDQRRLCKVLIDLGTAELNSGNEETAWAVFDRAATLSKALGDTERTVDIALALTSGFHVARMDFDPRLVRLIEELLTVTDRSKPALRALLLTRLVFILAWVPVHERLTALGREAYELIKTDEDPRVRAPVVTAFCIAADHPGDLQERLRMSEEAVRLCAVTQDLQGAQFAHVMRILACLEAGRLDCVREQATATREVIQRLRLRHPSTLAVPLAHAGLLAHIDGRLDDLEMTSKEADALAGASGDPIALSVADVQAAFVHLERGREHDATPITRKWVAIVPDVAIWRCFLTLALTRARSDEEARSRLREFAVSGFVLQPDWQWLACMAMLAEVCATLGEGDHAPRLYEQLEPFKDRCITVGVACFFIGSVERYLGLLAETRGLPALANEHFEKANEVHARIGARLMLAYSLCDQALLVERTTELGQRAGAAELRRRATELAAELGAVHLQKRLAATNGDAAKMSSSLLN